MISAAAPTVAGMSQLSIRAQTSWHCSISGGVASTISQPAASRAPAALATPSDTAGWIGPPGTSVRTAALLATGGPSKGTVTDFGSRGWRPAMTSTPSRRSATWRAIGPSTPINWNASVGVSAGGMVPALGKRPKEVFNEVMPQQ